MVIIRRCTNFSRVLKLEIEKMGTLKKKWGPNGDPKSEKGPHGDPGPQMRTHLGAVLLMFIFLCDIRQKLLYNQSSQIYIKTMQMHVSTSLISFLFVGKNSQEGMRITTRIAETSESSLIAAYLKLIIAFGKSSTLMIQKYQNLKFQFMKILKTCQKYQRCRTCNEGDVN